MDKAQRLIQTAVQTLGSQAELARALGVTRQSVTNWKQGHEPIPDRHILRMATLVGWKPVETALEVYKERLGELVRALTLGVHTVILTFATPAANDAYARDAAAPNV